MSFKQIRSFVWIVCFVLGFSACNNSNGTSPTRSSYGGPAGVLPGGPSTTAVGTSTPRGEGTTPQNYFYFSYDDSASTAGVELVKYELKHNRLPLASLARPWEFLNYESFDTKNAEPIGTFRMTMGLLERPGTTTDISEYHLGVSMSSPKITREERQNVVLTLIVDVSGSMGELTVQVDDIALTKLDVVKYGLTQLPVSLKEGDILNLVTFETTASIVLQNVPYSDISTSFIPAVNALALQGSTNLDDGIQKGYQAALHTFDATKMNRVVIITDAYANTGEVNSSVIAQHTRINEAEGIYFSGIGVGADFNEAFLNELTEVGKGGYFSVITNYDVKRALQDRFIGLVSVAARHVQFRLDYPESLKHITTASEELSTDPKKVSPTNFSYNTSQYFYEVFTVATSTDRTQTFTLTITYTDPKTFQPVTEKVTRTLGDLLGREESNIRDAETIFLFVELLGGRINVADVNRIRTLFYPNYSSPLFTEYQDLMNKLQTLKGEPPPSSSVK